MGSTVGVAGSKIDSIVKNLSRLKVSQYLLPRWLDTGSLRTSIRFWTDVWSYLYAIVAGTVENGLILSIKYI